jgi:DNA-binding XRE family transcriptional regulator
VWGYRLSAQRRHGTASKSSTSSPVPGSAPYVDFVGLAFVDVCDPGISSVTAMFITTLARFLVRPSGCPPGRVLGMEVNPTRCKELRTARAMSIRKLAEEAGVSTETIYSLEHSHRDFIWPKTARKLADALGVDTDDLYR